MVTATGGRIMLVSSFDEFVARHGIAGALRQLELKSFSDFNDIARFAAMATHRSEASVYLCWEDQIAVIGGYNIKRSFAYRNVPDDAFKDGVAEYQDAINELGIDTTFSSLAPEVRSIALFQMHYGKGVIGGIAVHSSKVKSLLSENERAVLTDLARTTQELVIRRARLKYVAFNFQTDPHSYGA